MRRHTLKNILGKVKILDNDETDIDLKLLEEEIRVTKHRIEEAQKWGQKFMLVVESFVVIAIIVLVAVGGIHYQYNLLSPSIQLGNGS